MLKALIKHTAWIGSLVMILVSCSAPALLQQRPSPELPSAYGNGSDTLNISETAWKKFFVDPYLINLIDTALKNNQELNITLQEIEIAKNEVLFRKGPLRPLVNGRVGTGVEKVGRYTSQGAGDASTDIVPGKEVPDPLTDLSASVYATWELDIWKKLRNAKSAALARYLSSVEGKNFVVTNLVAEVASTYYELQALDNQLKIIRQNIALQQNALEVVKIQKEASRVTELAVQKFSAEVLRSRSMEYEVLQSIRENENRLNFLLARYPQIIARDTSNILTMSPPRVTSGLPSQLLANRPDIRQAELQLEAAKLDVKVARAEFYPSLGISAGIGLQAFKPSYFVKMPESILYSLAADLTQPLINKAAIKAEFSSASARQVQALYNYERSILNAYVEVATQLSRIDNLGKSYELKAKQVDALTRSIDISNDLFRSARADYLEVLMTQRDALEAKLQLIENRKEQLLSVINVYRDLGGGWR